MPFCAFCDQYKILQIVSIFTIFIKKSIVLLKQSLRLACSEPPPFTQGRFYGARFPPGHFPLLVGTLYGNMADATTPYFAQGKLLWSAVCTRLFHLMPGRHTKFDGTYNEPSTNGAAQRIRIWNHRRCRLPHPAKGSITKHKS